MLIGLIVLNFLRTDMAVYSAERFVCVPSNRYLAGQCADFAE